MQTFPDKSSEHAVCYQGNLLVTPIRIWQFSDANFAEENTKTVNVNLKTKKKMVMIIKKGIFS